jgi:hypothetical protein
MIFSSSGVTCGPQALQILVRVPALFQHGQVHRILLPHGLARRGDVLGRFDNRAGRSGVVRYPNLRSGLRARADGLHREPMAQHDIMVQLRQAFRAYLQAWGVQAVAVAQLGERAHLIHRHEVLAAAGKFACRVSGIVGEGLGRIAILPASAVLQRLRQIPVVERAEGLNASFEQSVHQPLIEVHALLVRRARAGREDARPGGGEAKALQAHRLHDRDVLWIAMVEVVRHIAGITLKGLARRMRKRIPDTWTTAVCLVRALYLVARRGGSPKKALRKRARIGTGHRIPGGRRLSHLRQARTGKREGGGGSAQKTGKRTAGE